MGSQSGVSRPLSAHAIAATTEDAAFERWKLLKDEQSLDEFKSRTRSSIEADLAIAVGKLSRKELLSAVNHAYSSLVAISADKLETMSVADAKQWLSECAVDSITG